MELDICFALAARSVENLAKDSNSFQIYSCASDLESNTFLSKTLTVS